MRSEAKSEKASRLAAMSWLADRHQRNLEAARQWNKALRALPLGRQLAFWPVVVICLFGLQHFVQAVSSSIGDIFITQAIYPAKPFLWIVVGLYLIWALREIWFALRNRV